VLRPTVPIGRLAFLLWGVGLFAVKTALDLIAARVFHQPYSLLFYVSPMDAPLFRRNEAPEYWAVLWGIAIPFIFVGVILTLRRLRDASLSPWLVLLFFVPFANFLFFAVASAAPPHQTSAAETAVAFPRMAYRSSTYQATPPPRERAYGASIAMAALLGGVIGLGAVGISVGVMRSYGAGLMLGAPIFSGFATSMFYVKLRPNDGYAGAALATFLSFLFSFAVTIGFALEGLGCLVMFVPLVVPVTFFGSFMGWLIAKSLTGSRSLGQSGIASMLVLPAVLGAEAASPLPEAPADVVESVVVVDAPPDVVWKRVIAFPPLDPPQDFMFRHGIAAPMRATIDGEGPGAIRRCVFTTGTFVEPIEVWRPGRELTFSVTAQPDPMIEQTLWNSVRPPHLDGYLQTTKGQFLLEPLEGGTKTRLVGRTWYRTHMTPEPYWRLWADPIIHRIHLRVLDHVKRLAESDARSL
jgi:uncharacterized membrane protein YhaH (DUF805 family)